VPRRPQKYQETWRAVPGTARINALRGLCREFGIAIPVGARTGLEQIASGTDDVIQKGPHRYEKTYNGLNANHQNTFPIIAKRCCGSIRKPESNCCQDNLD